MHKYEIEIPFPGFYNGVLDMMIDDEILSCFDFEGTGDTDLVPDDFHMKYNGHDGMIAIAKIYAGVFQDYLDTEFNIKIDLPYKDMSSPKEYNFTTDRLFCEISEQGIKKLRKIASNKRLGEVIKARFTSYDGFISSYPNNIVEWLGKDCLEYDHNELGTLLIAAVLSQIDGMKGWCSETKYFEEHYGPDTYTLMEEAISNGNISTAVFNNMPQECQDIANKAYEVYELAQKEPELEV